MASILTTPAAVTLTEDQKKARAKLAVIGGARNLFRQMLSTFTNSMEIVWANPDGLTPQKVFDALGTDSVEVLRLASILKDAINAANPGTITSSPPATITPNADGTVTITAAA